MNGENPLPPIRVAAVETLFGLGSEAAQRSALQSALAESLDDPSSGPVDLDDYRRAGA